MLTPTETREMNRRAFIQSVILGTLAAPFVTREIEAREAEREWLRSSYHYWRQQAQTPNKQSYDNLRAAMREIHAQCQRDYDRRPTIHINMDRVQAAVNQRLTGQL